jgi:hypothetical protein
MKRRGQQKQKSVQQKIKPLAPGIPIKQDVYIYKARCKMNKGKLTGS